MAEAGAPAPARGAENEHRGLGRERYGTFVDRFGHDDAVDAPLQQRLHGTTDVPRVAFERVDHAQRVPGVPRGPLDAYEKGSRAVQGCPQCHHADGPGPPRGQRPCRAVQPVAELLGGFQNAARTSSET
jgi:hypothetical protein